MHYINCKATKKNYSSHATKEEAEKRLSELQRMGDLWYLSDIYTPIEWKDTTPLINNDEAEVIYVSNFDSYIF